MDEKIIALCDRLAESIDQTKVMDRELRSLLNIDTLSLDQCEQVLDFVPVCYTRYKLVERICELREEVEQKSKA